MFSLVLKSLFIINKTTGDLSLIKLIVWNRLRRKLRRNEGGNIEPKACEVHGEAMLTADEVRNPQRYVMPLS
jgi:hypothetical protein